MSFCDYSGFTGSLDERVVLGGGERILSAAPDSGNALETDIFHLRGTIWVERHCVGEFFDDAP